MPECCKNCKYWKPKLGNDKEGYCRRFPPRSVIKYSALLESTFPETLKFQWCGEYEWDCGIDP